MFVLGLLAALLVMAAACNRQPEGEPSPVPATVAPIEATDEPATTPADTPTLAPSDTPTSPPITEAEMEASLAMVRDFLGKLSTGAYREAYGSELTTAGQERLSELILGRLALSNPHISFFELLGAEPQGDRISVAVVWRETYDGQGDVGDQQAHVLLARQDDGFLVDDIELGAFEPAATPIPPSLPRADVITEAPTVGQPLSVRASGFQGGETILAWLELPDGVTLDPVFGVSDADGTFETTYDGSVITGLEAGNWIWWVQALRDSSRNAGITFAVAPEPTAVPTEPPTATPRPVVVQPTQPPAVPPTEAPPTDTPAPSTAYGAPILLWPEPLTSREYNSALIVEFQPVAEALAFDEYYQLNLTATDQQGNVYNGGSIQGKGDACSGQYSVPCRQLIADERFMRPFFLDGVEARLDWSIQVVKDAGIGQFTPISPASEAREVILKPRSQ